MDGVVDWSLKIDAVGDFKQLATSLHEFSIENMSDSEDTIAGPVDVRPSGVVS